MADNDAVIIKGIRGGLLILLDDQEEFGALLAELRERLGQRESFFRGATVTVNLGRRIIDEPEFGGLRDALQQYDDALDVVVSTSDQSRAVAAVHGVRQRIPAFARRAATAWRRPPPRRAWSRDRRWRHRRPRGASWTSARWPTRPTPIPSERIPSGRAGRAGLFVRRTLRSGQSIQHDGDICIIGDVNPGAEVVSSGDVVVWGSLRGTVHAGAGGDAEALICALHLRPPSCASATCAGAAPKPARPGGQPGPEMARVAEGRIVVEPWAGPRPRR